MNCPKCQSLIPDAIVAAHLGGKGGLTRGKVKARTPEQARKAALIKWKNWRKAKRVAARNAKMLSNLQSEHAK